MTSKTFSSKTFPKLYKWAFKRNRPVLVAYAVLMILGVILDIYAISQLKEDNHSYLTLAESISEIGIVSIIIAQAGAIFFTFVSALLTFSFLHNKRSVDMFGALPTTRETMYISHALGGMSAVAAPFALGSFIVMGVTCRTGAALISDLWLILCGILGIAASYAFTALIAYCCGTTMDTALITIAANAIYIGSVCMFQGMASAMIPGIDFENIIFSPVISLLVPYGFCFFEDFYYMDDMFSSFVILLIWHIIFMAAVTILGVISARRRKAEIAQSEFGVKWLPVAVKVGGSVVAGGVIGMVAALESSSGYGNMFVFAFWYVIISFAAFFIIHIVFARGFKGRFVPSLIAYICATAAIIGVTFGLTTGMGIDTYVPNPSNVRSVQFGMYEYKEKENIETVTQIHKLITSSLHESNEYPYYLGSASYSYDYPEYSGSLDYDLMESADTPAAVSEDYSYEDLRRRYPLTCSTSLYFTYKKKIGFMTQRGYYSNYYDEKNYDLDAIEALLQRLYSSEESKRQDHPELWDRSLIEKANNVETATLGYEVYDPTAPTGTYYTDRFYRTVGTENLPNGINFINGLFDAVTEDILADTEYYKCTNVSSFKGDSYLTVTVNYISNPQSNVEFGGWTYSSGYRSVNLVIPEYYTNTIEYLNSKGIDTTFNYEENSVDPFAYISSNERADDYRKFGYTGDYSWFYPVAKDIAVLHEFNALVKSGYDGDTVEWVEAHNDEFTDAYLLRASELYNEFKNDPKNIKSGYTNPAMSPSVSDEDFNNGEYFYLEDQLIDALGEESINIVNDINSGKKPAAAEESTGSGTDSKTESKTESKSEKAPETPVKSVEEAA